MKKPEVSTREYEVAHLRKPRGQGHWAFCPADRYNDMNYLDHVVWFGGTYAEAKRKAQEYFKGKTDRLVVCT